MCAETTVAQYVYSFYLEYIFLFDMSLAQWVIENIESIDIPPLTLCNYPFGCDAFLIQIRV